MNDKTDMQSASSFDAIHLQASDWIERRDFGLWTETDKAQFDAWLTASLAHRLAFLRADTSWKSTEMLTVLRPFRFRRDLFSARALRTFSKIVMAVVFLAVVGGADLIYRAMPHYTTYSTPIGGHQVVALADGSKIELNTNTTLRIAQNDNGRNIVLESGEAYFEVKHDGAHPFVVTVGTHRLTDLGTKFFVRKHDDGLAVSLVEGLVRFDDKAKDGRERVLTLVPGDALRVTATSMSVGRTSAATLLNELGWRRGVLIFDRASLAEIADEVNRYNRKKLIIADAAVGRINIGGTFRIDDVQAIANAAREAFDLHVEDRGDAIVISR
jgi:transmembrane sensor